MTAKQQTTTRIAAIGVGYWGKNLVRNFAELGCLAALADPDRDAAAALAGKYRVPVLDWQAVLDDSAIDGVAIAAPAVLHARLAQEALEAGKHVFVEKPLALAVAEAEALTRLAERQDRRLMVGHLLQYHPAFTALRDLVREGALGRLQYIYSNRLNLGKVRREEDIWKALQGEALPVDNGGIATRDFIYVDDIVEGLVLCALRGTAGEVYNLASGVETSIKDLAVLVNALAGNRAPLALKPARDWDRSGKRYGDPTKARSELGFSATVALRDGLLRTIDWTRRRSHLIERCIARHAGFMHALEPGTVNRRPADYND